MKLRRRWWWLQIRFRRWIGKLLWQLGATEANPYYGREENPWKQLRYWAERAIDGQPTRDEMRLLEQVKQLCFAKDAGEEPYAGCPPGRWRIAGHARDCVCLRCQAVMRLRGPTI